MASIVAPAALKQGMKYSIVFVTDGTTDAIHADHQYYDGLVQAEAAANGLDKNPQPVKWLALISSRDGTKATERLPIDGVPIYNLSGDQVATGATTLWDQYKPLLRPIDQSPTVKSVITGNVWTGTRPVNDVSSNPLGAVYRQECAASSITSYMFGDNASFVTQPNEQMRLVAFSEVFSVG